MGRGVGLLPVHLQKLSALGFVDAGAAWCEGAPVGAGTCAAGDTPRTWMQTVGGELVLDVGLNYDQLYRLRVGIADARRGVAPDQRAPTVYFTIGSTF